MANTKKTQYDIEYNKTNTKQCNFRLSRISQQKEIDIFESIPDKASFFTWALHEWQRKEEAKAKPFVPRHEIPNEEKVSMDEYLRSTITPKSETVETHTHSPEVNRDIMNRYLERVRAINEYEKNKKA